MTDPHVIRPLGFDTHIAPFAFQHYARDFFDAYRKHKGGPPFSPARLFLITRSIELAAKALHLQRGGKFADVSSLGHDLLRACEAEALQHFGIQLTDVEKQELNKANAYYERKGFEYFLYRAPNIAPDRSGPHKALSGWPDLPDEPALESVLTKLLEPKL
jgi:hypothetical protein